MTGSTTESLPGENPTGATSPRPSLERVLNPRSVAVVGISDNSPFLRTVERSIASGAEFHFVHPRVDTVMGHPTYPDLLSLGQPVDAVFTGVAARGTVGICEAGAELGIGGVITFAAGFAEVGEEGEALQQRIQAAARRGGFPLIGPNGVGMINVPRQMALAMLPDFSHREGGLSVVTHSGAMVEAVAASAWRAGGVGVNLLISAGNEAVTDLADYLEYLADDAQTRVVALIVEKVRRPDAFFAAARRCLEAGKPIVAMKLGRSERSQRMAASHTGTLTGDTWVYDVAFRQAGIQLAYDIDDLVDRVQFLEQLPRHRWNPINGLAVLTVSGGSAQLASDLAEVEGVAVPEVPRLRPFVQEHVPGGSVSNPLDTTGHVALVPELFAKVVDEYSSAPEFDSFLWTSQHAEWDVGAQGSVERIVTSAAGSTKTFVVAPLSGDGGRWLDRYREQEIGVGNGLRGTLKGLSTMGAFVRTRHDATVVSPDTVAELPRPDVASIPVAEGTMLPFSDTMELLASAGLPVAPYHLVPTGSTVTAPPFGGPYVVKLADVAHRTEHGAVSVDVDPRRLDAEVDRLRRIAEAEGLPGLVAIQPMASGIGEAFIGIQGDSELGPVVAFGLGGVYIELLNRIGGRMAPMTEQDAVELVAEFDDTGVLDGFRGAPPWDRQSIVTTLVAASMLAAAGRSWIASLDINPLIVTADGLLAVDGLCLVR